MKIKVLLSVMATTAAFTATSSAVTLTLSGVANTNVGTINLNGNLVSGTAVFVSSTEILSGVSNALGGLIFLPNPTMAQFDSVLAGLIGTTSATDPGVVRTVEFTNGLLLTSAAAELGSVGNNTYLFLVAQSGGVITGMGAYTGSSVPNGGSVTFTSAFANDGLNFGTSVQVGTNGFQLVGGPEPSTAFLGVIGALSFFRRRRN